MPSSRALLFSLAALIGLGPVAPAIGQGVTHIENTGTLSFDGAGGRQTVSSNTVAVDVNRTKRPTSLSFRQLPAGYQLSGMSCQTSPTPSFTPAPIDAATLALAAPLQSPDVDTPMIMVLDNQGGNKDRTMRETSWITVTAGDFELKVPLLETGPNTGVFAGGVPAGGADEATSPCDPTLKRMTSLKISFTEDDDSLSSTFSLLIDPAGYVFDSMTGALIDGAQVTLLDDNDQPAKVFGEDGVSVYPSTVVTGSSAKDAGGRTYTFKQGQYRFPLVAAGRYHLRIIPPDPYVAPSKRDRAAVALLKDPTGNNFLLNEASFGGIFELSTPDPFYSDIPIDRVGDTQLLLTKTASVREASPGDFVQYRVTLMNRGDAPATNVHLTDIMPRGLRYEVGSSRGADAPTVSGDGRNLDFTIPVVPAKTTVEVRYVVSVAPGAPTGEAINRVLASGANGATANEAAAAVRLKPLLFTDGFTVVGRVTEGDCHDPVDHRKGVAGVRLLMEDGTYVVTDRDGLYHFEGVRPGRHVVQLDKATIPASHEAVACDQDTRQAKSAISRFVESQGGLLKRVDFQLRPNGKAAAAKEALPITVADDATAAGNRNWFAGQQPGVEMLFPQVDHNPRAPAVRVVIKHLPSQHVALRINGELSDPLAFDTTDVDPTGKIAISRWTGIPIVEGDNQIEARILDAQGATVTTIARVVYSASIAAHATIVPEKSRLVADGVTRPLLAVRVTDREGHPVRDGTMLPFHLDQPYTAAIDAELEQGRQLTGKGRATTTARVTGDEGLAFIALEPTMQAGSVHAQVTLTEEKVTRTSDIRAWLAASAKDWVVVGFGAGTLGYDTLSKHRSWFGGTDDKTVADGQLALYAKGRIKGSWLATIAYDSSRTRDLDRGLLGTIDPDRYYTVYGDGSRQGYDAPTQRKLYLRLERREFYALFGDYETGLTETQLGRYSRTLNGAKLAFNGNHVSVTAFAANSDQLYARDEIQGNGLSGPYRLSGRNIVPNSDKLHIEVRDRFRSELIVSSTQMTRHIDYDIDTDAGTIRFREPILTRDANLNPIIIVVDYETYGTSKKRIAGGRVAMKLAKGKVEVGATALRDESVTAATVLAVDAKAKIGQLGELRAEAATGGEGGLDAGRAWLVEAEHHGPMLDLLGYARQQDLGFGVGQQNLVEAGSRKLGLDGRLRLTSRLSLTGTAWHQDQLVTGGERTAIDTKIELRRPNGTIFIGGQWVADRGIDGKDRDSRLLTLGGTQAVLNGKLTLTGQTQVAPGGDKDSADFPIRHQLMLAYAVKPGIRLLGGYEIAQGKDFTAHTKRVGFDLSPWAGAKLMSTVNQQGVGTGIGENGQRTFAQYGLNQSLPLGPNWTVDATLDASSTVRGSVPTGAVINAFQPVASGGSLVQDGTSNADYTAATLGANYRARLWSWNGRLEYRRSDNGNRFGITSNLLRSLGEGRTLASSIRWYQVKQDGGATAATITADVSLAWRPLDSQWSILERLSMRKDRADAGFTDTNVLGVAAYGGGYQATLRFINNVAINYRSGPEGAGHGIEATVYYGTKWVSGSFAEDDYSGLIDVIGFELRRDLGRRFDVGVQASVQHAWERKSVAFSAGPSIGVSPAENVWITAGYNITGYRDRDFSKDRYTRQGAYLTFRLKFDQQTIGDAARSVFGKR